MKSIMENLADYLVFYDMPDEYIQFIANNAELKIYSREEIIFTKSGQASHFYIITRGEVELSEELLNYESILPTHSVKEGEMLGWSWLVPPFLWNYNCKAIQETEVIEVDAASIRHEISRDREFGYHFYKRLYYTVVERLFNTRYQIMRNESSLGNKASSL